MPRPVGDPAGYQKALQAAKSEVKRVSKWNRYSTTLMVHATNPPGTLEKELPNFSRIMGDLLRSLTDESDRSRLQHCIDGVEGAIGQAAIHAGYEYREELNVMEGWTRVWDKLNTALRSLEHELGRLPTGGSGSKGLEQSPADRISIRLKLDGHDQEIA
ncbi:hypothetical protein ACIBLB_28765 [Streptosporangium canum]|uniref:hypothetical protein n=1 Tax=Streptosporangium canum TaxID=324952 RepID=UPI0037949700